MKLASIIMIRDRERDTYLNFGRTEEHPDKILVEFIDYLYCPRDINKFYIKDNQIEKYIHDVLKSLSLDNDPFDEIQVTTLTFPCIIYHVSELDDKERRKLILNILMQSISMRVQLGQYIVEVE